MSNQLTVKLGVGACVWTMPTLVHRLEVLQRQHIDGMTSAAVYALLAGLPSSVLGAVGLTGKPALDLDNAERLLERQGCTVADLQSASVAAWRAVLEWYREAMPDEEDGKPSGNEEAAPPDGQG